MEEVHVGVIYNTLLDSNEGNLSPHAPQTIYFSNLNENKISDRETPVELLSLEINDIPANLFGQYIKARY